MYMPLVPFTGAAGSNVVFLRLFCFAPDPLYYPFHLFLSPSSSNNKPFDMNRLAWVDD